MELIRLATGEVTSPNYPNNYPNGLLKTDTIQVEQGLVLSLQFTAFDIYTNYIYNGSPVCTDHLSITDGDGTMLMEKSCVFNKAYVVIGGESTGSSLPPDITSTSNIVNLVFSTDGRTTSPGWSVSWSAVTPGVSIFLDHLSNSFLLLPRIKSLLNTRFGLPFFSSSHSWPTLHSAPWSPGLPLREPH